MTPGRPTTTARTRSKPPPNSSRSNDETGTSGRSQTAASDFAYAIAIRNPVKPPGPTPTAKRSICCRRTAGVVEHALDDREPALERDVARLAARCGDPSVARDRRRKRPQRSVEGKNVHCGGRRCNVRGSSPAPSISISYRRDGIASGALRHHSISAIEWPSSASSRPSSSTSRGSSMR